MEHSAGAFIVSNEGKYLLVKSRTGTWGFPKGHVEPTETEKEAAVRETKEETGIEISIQGNKFTRIIYQTEKGTPKQTVYFMATAITTNITINDEIADAIWLPYNEAKEKITHEDLRKAFEEIIRETP